MPAVMDPAGFAHIEAATIPAISQLVTEIATDMRATVAVDEGDLLASIEEEHPTTKPVGRVHVGGENADYWATVEYGSQPHIIRSTGPWPLRSKEGQVFGREVHHPGTPAQPFARPAIYRQRAIRVGMP